MKKEMGQKGLSDVVTTVLIILFGIVAVAIIGGIVLSQVRGTGAKIDSAASCQMLSITPVQCITQGGGVGVTVKRDAGGSEVTVVKVSILGEMPDGSAKTASLGVGPTALSTNLYNYSAPTSGIVATELAFPFKRVSVAATIRQADGKDIQCDYSGIAKVECQ